MIGHDARLYARSFADVYDEWYGALDDPQELVQIIAARCPPKCRIVELGSGTGRLARPLNIAGHPVIAIDVSASMLAASAEGPQRVAADMTQLPLAPALCDVAFIAYNTLFNLASRTLQKRCFAEAARIVRPGGFFIVEAFIAPSNDDMGFGLSRRPHPHDPKRSLSIVTGPDPDDDDVIVGSHIETGVSTTCRPWRLTYQSPAQLDRCAEDCGLTLDRRTNDWRGDSFDPDGVRHVSWYKHS